MEGNEVTPLGSGQHKLMVKVKAGTGNMKEANALIIDMEAEPEGDCLVLALMNIGVATLTSSEEARTKQYLILGVVTTLIPV